MIRCHYSAKPIKRLRAMKPWEEGAGAYKPKGFWYEVDGDWLRWCEAENFDDLTKKLCYRLELDGERILNIRGLADFDAFHREYVRVEAYPGAHTKAPDWRAIADQYDGIEIAPYLWERRLGMETMWYYGWDCASGVLWNPRGTRLVLHESAATSTRSEIK